MNDAAYQELARRIVALENRVNGAKPQLTHSSIENGSIKEYDQDGVLAGIVGRQWDGTHGFLTVTGPPPPKPALGAVTPIAGGLRVRYDATFDPPVTINPTTNVSTPVTMPEDLSRIEVHADTSSTFSALTFLTLRRSIESPRGGEVEFGIPQDTDYWVKLVIRTKAGKLAVSDAMGPFRAGKVTAGDTDIDFTAFGGTTVHYGPADPTLDPEAVINYGDLWLKEISAGPPPKYRIYRRLPGDTWAELQDQSSADALAQVILAQQAADSKAKIFTQDDTPAWTGAAGTAVWYDTNNGNRMQVWNGTTFVDRLLGTGAFQPQSIIASDVLATGTVSASLLEAVLVLATELIGGDPNNTHVKMSGAGFEIFNLNPEGFVQRSGGLSTGADGLNLVDPATGQTNVSLLPSGDAAVRSFTVTGLDSDADGLIDGGMAIYGKEFLDYLDDHSRGSVASGFYADAANGIFASGITTRFGLGEISFEQKAGRNYLIIFTGLHAGSSVSGDRILFSVRATTDGSTPTISNGVVQGSSILMATGSNTSQTAPPIILFGSYAAGATVRLLVTVERLSGTGTITTFTYESGDPWRAPFRFFSADMGRDIPDTYIPNDGGGVRAGGSPSATPKKQYTSTWAVDFIGNYEGSGARRTDTTDMMQGFTSYDPGRGTQRSLAGFTSGAEIGEIGKTITTALAGATVQKVEMIVRCNHSHSYAGGMSRIGYHGNSTLPATMPAATWEGFGGAFFKRGETRAITLPSSTHANWANGTYRGFTFGPAGDYMRFDGVGPTRPALRITYTR